MPLAIALESALSDDGRALIAESQSALEAVYPPEDIFSFDTRSMDTADLGSVIMIIKR